MRHCLISFVSRLPDDFSTVQNFRNYYCLQTLAAMQRLKDIDSFVLLTLCAFSAEKWSEATQLTDAKLCLTQVSEGAMKPPHFDIHND
jgi:hypothetical protein